MNNLEEALKQIREACKQAETCKQCPLHNKDDNCGLRDSAPENWKLISDPFDGAESLFR